MFFKFPSLPDDADKVGVQDAAVRAARSVRPHGATDTSPVLCTPHVPRVARPDSVRAKAPASSLVCAWPLPSRTLTTQTVPPEEPQWSLDHTEPQFPHWQSEATH